MHIYCLNIKIRLFGGNFLTNFIENLIEKFKASQLSYSQNKQIKIKLKHNKLLKS